MLEMEIVEIVKKLDKEFSIKSNQENLTEWAVTNENKNYINLDFLERKTGLMTKNSTIIKKICTSVFITDNIVHKILKNEKCLIITHHNFNYFESEKGLQPIKPEILKSLLETKNSIYVAHAPLDTHKKYGTSLCLAELCEIGIEKLFFDYFGAPTALVGNIKRERFENFCERIRKKIQRPHLSLIKNHEYVQKIAVVAGGGDIPEILQQAYNFGCDTLFTGTIEHRWNLPFIQESNKKFHELNKKLKLNLIGGTHYATERPSMIRILEFFRGYELENEYIEDIELLNSK